VRDGFLGERYYVFDGGCATYRFNFQGEARAAPVNEATLALGFVTGAAVSDTLLRFTRGYYKLDPPASG
jgi:hypothetical protein